MKQSIFVVEDEPDIARLLRHHLEGGGYSVRTFSGVSGVLDEAIRSRPVLFLLDIMVPGGSGLDLCDQIRYSEILAGTPIIFLTARASESDRVHGLERGADDYIGKPFSPRELLARVKAVLRRFEPAIPIAVRELGELRINTGGMTVTVRGSNVATTATEFRLLDYFARHPGRVFTRDQLLDAVWRDTAFVTPRSVDVYVRRLREKIESNPEDPRYLRTVRGAGYRFEVPR